MIDLNRVKSLSNVLRDLEDVFPERSFTDEQTAHLKDILQACSNTLANSNKVLDKYHELGDNTRTGFGTKSRHLWKRMTFEPDDVRELRSLLGSNVGLLNAFMGSAVLYVSP